MLAHGARPRKTFSLPRAVVATICRAAAVVAREDQHGVSVHVIRLQRVHDLSDLSIRKYSASELLSTLSVIANDFLCGGRPSSHRVPDGVVHSIKWHVEE